MERAGRSLLGRGVGEVDSARLIERLCFLFPPVIGVGIVGVLQEAAPGVSLLRWGLLQVSAFGYTALTLGLALALFLDARRLRTQSRAVANWRPNPWINAAFALVWAPAAGVVYLHRRHKRLGTPVGWHGWWFVVALTLATTLAGAATAAVAFVLAMPTLFATAVGLTGAIALGTFPIALHQDAAYVSTRRTPWRPNPGTYLGLAFLSLSLPVIQPVLAAYYLYRRRRVLGVP
ncbi:hypothetical protein [Natronobiforma cellulositropha]|uniref:hypothetical protein n=1 Tax=Natronobiforma cellulositropha TaxID=1679076 RepID=UPI0021D5F3AF|nr:hypothetical protein [Natronobiforma cellulositropha]